MTGPRNRAKAKEPALAPAMPPPTADEEAFSRWFQAEALQVIAKLQQRNLDTAVLLAQQAAQHGGELEEWFAEIGRRYEHLLDTPPKPKLRVVKGGAA